MAARTGFYQTRLVLMLQANGKKHVNMREVSPGIHWGSAHGHFLLCDCEDHAGFVMWGNHERNLQEDTTFWGCPWYSEFDSPIVYTALILNWCFWETPPMSDPEHFLICPTRLQPSAVIAGCKIIFQRKRTGEKRGWKHRAEEISKELVSYRRMDNIGMTNISAEGGRACQSICEDYNQIIRGCI